MTDIWRGREYKFSLIPILFHEVNVQMQRMCHGLSLVGLCCIPFSQLTSSDVELKSDVSVASLVVYTSTLALWPRGAMLRVNLNPPN